MEINTIYNNYAQTNQSFDSTLRLLQDLLNERLNPDFRTIRVQGSNGGKIMLCFTLFYTRDRFNESGSFHESYEFRFQEVKNFRNFRPDAELGYEVAQIENLIESFRTRSLFGVI